MKQHYFFQGISLLLISFLLLIACREEAKQIQNFKNMEGVSIQYKKLSEISGLKESVNKIKKEFNLNNKFNKGIEELDLDEENVLVMNLKDSGKLISINVNHDVSETSYFVMNLNILQHNGIETYYLTKYIPSNGKPFYSYSDFIGTIEVYDIDGNLITSSTPSPTAMHMHFILGCYAYVINDNAGFWQIQSVACVDGCSCDSGGGGNGSTGNGNNSGDGGYSGDGSNGGGYGGGGGEGGGNSNPIFPNIPTQDFLEQKRYQGFLNQLTQQQLQFLAEHDDYNNNVFNYLKSLNFNPSNYNLMSVVINHFMSNTNNLGVHVQWQDIAPLFPFVKQFLQDNPDTQDKEQIFARIKAFKILIDQNPNALLNIPCDELPQWQSIATHQVPQSVKTKMQNIKNQTNYYTNWEITDLDDGLGARLNMDLFPVKITTMPDKPNGQKYTHSEFFEFFRKNINLFAEKFTPIVDNYYGIDDTALWNSTNPLGALIHIKIPLDDGTVVCSGVSTNTWIFSTVKAPLDWYHDGVHPVAGNRAFSFYTNPDGSITIYTRGVDRVSHNYSDTTSILNHLIETGAFLGADILWSGMQEKLKLYIDTHGGSANIVQSKKYRPDYNKIKNFIKGNAPLSSLGCH